MRARLREPVHAWALLATLAALVLVAAPSLGSDPWPFVTSPARAHGIVGPLVRAAHGQWDVDILRTSAVLAGALLVPAALVALRRPRWRGSIALAFALVVVLMLLAPGVVLQAGLRDGTAPWFHVNDSTYQIEIAGKLVRSGENPYGHDYIGSGLERFYSRDGTVDAATIGDEVALRHFAYFPGTALLAAAWGVLPTPFDDFRFLLLLATLLCVPAFLVFDAPLTAALAAGVVVAANPLSLRAAWFGTADAPSILLLVLAFALVSRSRYVWAGAVLGGALLCKQFALVALPFLALAAWLRGARRRGFVLAGVACAGVFAAGTLPFAIADPGAFYRDTISYGATTYRIIGYGVSGLLVKAGVLERRGSYPFVWLAALVWLPVTAWLLREQARLRSPWVGAAGFTASMYVLLFVSRVFQTSYLIWPLTGLTIAVLLWIAGRDPQGSASAGPDTASRASRERVSDTARAPTPATSP
jgi:hypothetical protein